MIVRTIFRQRYITVVTEQTWIGNGSNSMGMGCERGWFPIGYSVTL